jgi:putative phage-type endonuclease
MIIVESEQRTNEWLSLRKGKFTASDIHKIMGVKGLGKTGETYVWEKVAESIGADMPDVTSYAMSRGISLESEAKDYYTSITGKNIVDQPFIIADWCENAGCSPDGFIEGSDTGFEVKCPINPVIHVKRFLYKSQEDLKANEPEIYWQIMMAMAVTGFTRWVFASYFPDIYEDYTMFRLTIQRDEKDIILLIDRITEAEKLKNDILNMIQYESKITNFSTQGS